MSALKLKNTLVRNAVENCIRGAQEIMQFFPLCTIHFTWIKGTENTADPLTKMFPYPIQLSNGDRWIHGSDVMKTQQSNTAHTFLKVDCEKGVQYLGLPEEITKIEQNKAKLTGALGAERFDDREQEARCLRCGMDEEFCGTLLTGAQSRKQSSGPEMAPQPPKNPVSTDNFADLSRRYRLDGDRNLIIHEARTQHVTAFNHDFYLESLQKFAHFLPFFFYLVHLLRWTVTTPDNGDLTPVMSKAWRKILITSQEIFEPQAGKNTKIVQSEGICCIDFRLLKYDSLRLFGSDVLPLISEKDPLLQKLIRYHHAPPRASTVGIHETQQGTIAAMQRGLFGSFNPSIKRLVSGFIAQCKNCNVARAIHYSDIPLGANSVKTSLDEKVFTNISIDPLGGIHVHPFSGGRNVVEIFPLLLACKTTGGVECILMDGVKTKNILLALQEMEACYSPIKKITCDAGS